MVSEIKKIASPAISGASETGKLIEKAKETPVGKAVIGIAKKVLNDPLVFSPLIAEGAKGVVKLLTNEKTASPVASEIQSQQANLQITPNK